MAKIRILLTIISIITFNLTALFGTLSTQELTLSQLLDNDFRLFWSNNDPGYIWHCFSTFSQWLAVLILSPFFLTYVKEYKSIDWKYLRKTYVENTIDLNKIKIIVENTDDNNETKYETNNNQLNT